MRALVIVAIVVSPTIGLSGQSVQPASKVHLCEIVKNPRRFAGKLVRTEGELFIGMAALGNSNCPPMMTGNFAWPPAVHLVGPPQQALDSAIDLAVKSKSKLCAAITGTIEAKKKYLVAKTSEGPKGMGFGHLSIYPAELNIVSAVVLPDCKNALQME